MTPKRIVLVAAGLAALFLADNAAAVSDYVIKNPTKLEGTGVCDHVVMPRRGQALHRLFRAPWTIRQKTF